MNFNDVVNALTFLSPIILLIGITIGVKKYKVLDIIHKSIVCYFVVMLCVDTTGRIIWITTGNNLIVLPIYSLIEILLFLVFYYKCLFRSRHLSIIGLGIAGILYILWELLQYKSNAKEFQSYSKVVDNFIVITLVLAFFYEKINKFRESKWDNFKLNAVILAYFSINLIFFLPINFLINETSGLKFYFWLVNLIVTILFYIYLTTLIGKNIYSQKEKP